MTRVLRFRRFGRYDARMATNRFAVINTTDGTFRVHRHDCRDVQRDLDSRANGVYFKDAADVDALIDSEIAHLRVDFGDAADHFEFVVLPCATK